MKQRLVIVSLHFRGKTISKLVMGKIINNKTLVSPKVIQDLKDKAGITRGLTYSIGGK
jgi:hypothetical protein